MQSDVLKVLHERLVLSSELDSPLADAASVEVQEKVTVGRLRHRNQLVFLKLTTVQRHYSQISVGV
jgi:hypothetical protein